jgi:phosphoribosyl 1,2-cyclic phosphate phosphodiesterase
VSPREPPPELAGHLLFLGTGTSVGVPVVGCDCPTCTSSDPRNQRLRCSVALGLPGGALLIDTTPDLRTQLLRARIGLIQAVLFTHDHADHLYGLDDLRLFGYYLGGPVPIHCEPSVEARIRRVYDYAFVEGAAGYAGGVPQLAFHSIGQEPFEVLGATVTPLRLHHGKFAVLGFRVGNVAYCTDCNALSDTARANLQGIEVLILDALRDREHPTHFSLEQAIETARSLGARRTYFTHMCHDLEHEATNRRLPPGMELAHDGLRIPLV